MHRCRRFILFSLLVLSTIILGCEISFSQRLYKLTVSPNIRGGTIVIPKKFVLGGEHLEIEVVPNKNYRTADASLQYTVGGKSVLIPSEYNKATFYMPAGDTELYVEFINDRDVSLVFPTEFYTFTGSIQLLPDIKFDDLTPDNPNLAEFIWQVEDTENFSIINGLVTCKTPGRSTKVTVSTIDNFASASCTVSCLPYEFEVTASGDECELVSVKRGSILPDNPVDTWIYRPDGDILANYAPPDENGKPMSIDQYYFFIPDAVDGKNVTSIKNANWADNLSGLDKVSIVRLPFQVAKLPAKAFTSFSGLKIFYAERSEPPEILGSVEPFFNNGIDIIYVNTGKVAAYSGDNVWGDYYKPNIIEKCQYRIRISTIINGTARINPDSQNSDIFGAFEGSKVDVIAEHDDNFELSLIQLVSDSGKVIDLTPLGDSQPDTNSNGYSFNMVDDHITVTVKFKLGGYVNVESGQSYTYTYNISGDLVKLTLYPYTGYTINNVSFIKTGNDVSERPTEGYTEKTVDETDDSSLIYKFSGIDRKSDVLWITVAVSPKSFGMKLNLNHEPWNKSDTVEITSGGNNPLTYDSTPAGIVFDEVTVKKCPHSTLKGIYYTDANGNKSPSYYAMDEGNTASGIRRWDHDADAGTVFTLTAEWTGEISNISFNAGYFSDPSLGVLSAIENTPLPITERYGEPMKNLSINAMKYPGFQLLGYADKPQTTEADAISGKLPDGATIYYEPTNDLKGNFMQPKAKGQKEGEQAPRGTYWDIVSSDRTNSEVVLYAIWKKETWNNLMIEEPLGVSRNMIYAPKHLAYLCSDQAQLDKTYYIMTDIDIGTVVERFFPIGSRLGTVADKDTGVLYLTPPNNQPFPAVDEFTGRIVPGKLTANGSPVEDTGYRRIRNLKIQQGSDAIAAVQPAGFVAKLGKNGSVSRLIFEESCSFSALGINCQGLGSVAGLVSGGSIADCKNYAPVTQIAAQTAGTQTSLMPVGGLIGNIESWQSNQSISKLENYGAVESLSDTGGLVGKAVFENEIQIAASFNEGKITSINRNTTVSSVTGAIGGLFGTISTKGYITVTSCYNSGQITTDKLVGGTGGLFGQVSRTTSSAILEINNCYSIGQVKASSYCAGFIGSCRLPARINNCYSFAHVVADAIPRAALVHATTTPIFSNCVVATGATTDYPGINLDDLEGYTVYKYLPIFQTTTQSTSSPPSTDILVYTKGSGINSNETDAFKPLGDGIDMEVLDILNGGYNSNRDPALDPYWKWGGGKDASGNYSLKEVVYYDVTVSGTGSSQQQVTFKNISRPVLYNVGEGINALPDIPEEVEGDEGGEGGEGGEEGV